jgi:Ras-related protein Rab-8A
MEGSSATLGVECISKIEETHKSGCVKLQLWHSTRQEAFQSISSGYYRNVIAVFFLFDLVYRKTYRALDSGTVDVGNKSDLAHAEVEKSEAEEFVSQHRMKYFECSAKLGVNVVEPFTSVLQNIDQFADEGKLTGP